MSVAGKKSLRKLIFNLQLNFICYDKSVMTNKSDKELVTRGMLDDAVKAILEGMDRLFGGLKAEFGGLKAEMNEKFDKIETDISYIKHDIRDIKAELSDTPSKREFNELKEKVESISA